MARMIKCSACSGTGSNGWGFCRICDGKGKVPKKGTVKTKRVRGGRSIRPFKQRRNDRGHTKTLY